MSGSCEGSATRHALTKSQLRWMEKLVGGMRALAGGGMWLSSTLCRIIFTSWPVAPAGSLSCRCRASNPNPCHGDVSGESRMSVSI